MADDFSPVNPRIELVVMSRPALDGFTPGHIMLATAVAGVGEKAWGFYPDGVKDEIVVGGWHRYVSSVVIPIDAKQYAHLLQTVERYRKTKKYQLLGTNCRHFVMTMLSEIGIDVPVDTLWPNDQGKQFMKKYGERWGQCLAE